MSIPDDAIPRWREDFPVPSEEDGYATRREFTKFLGLTSLAFLAGTCAAAARGIWKRLTATPHAAVRIAAVDDVRPGGYALFRYPTEQDPCILLRLSADKFVAFEQKCTHLSCPVHFDTAANQLVCPCHHGFFSAEDGRAVAGPPRRPLAQLAVSVRASQVWIETSGEHYT